MLVPNNVVYLYMDVMYLSYVWVTCIYIVHGWQWQKLMANASKAEERKKEERFLVLLILAYISSNIFTWRKNILFFFCHWPKCQKEKMQKIYLFCAHIKRKRRRKMLSKTEIAIVGRFICLSQYLHRGGS